MATVKTKAQGGKGVPFTKNDPRINRAGRRVGSRNKFTKAFIDAMLTDFEEHGAKVIEQVRSSDPSTYVRVATALMPSKSEAEIEVTDSTSDHVEQIEWDVIMGGLEEPKKAV